MRKIGIIKPRSLFCFFVLSFVFLFSLVLPVEAAVEGVVHGRTVNIRQGPGLNKAVLTEVKKGQVLSIHEEEDNWFKVSIQTGLEGWISGDYVHKVLRKVVVSGSVVKLRQGPGTSYQEMGQVKIGQTLNVVAEKNDWLQVLLEDLTLAWLSGQYVVTEQIKGQVLINTEVLNVRQGPGTNYALVTQIGFQEKHQVLAEKNGWYKISIKGNEGWVSGEYVQFIPETEQTEAKVEPEEPGSTVQVTGNIVNLRQESDINSAAIGTVKNGDSLTVLNRQGDWLQVRLAGGQIGWVAGWLTKPLEGKLPSRENLPKKEVLLIPIAVGKTFIVVDHGGKPELVLDGWARNEYKIKEGPNKQTLCLELQGPSTRRYEGKLTRLGISRLKVYPQQDQAHVEIEFDFATEFRASLPDEKKMTTVQLGLLPISTKGLQGKLIVLDPGHASIQPYGGLDPGATGIRLKLKEKDVNLAVALKLKSILEKAGAQVVLTHTGSTNLTLAQRAGVANSLKADVFVSIHANSGRPGVCGHTTYYYAPEGHHTLGMQRYARQKLATLVQRELVKSGGRRDAGVLEANFAVLRETWIPSILVETAFLSDPEEEILLSQDWYRQKLAEGIAHGLEAYFN